MTYLDITPALVSRRNVLAARRFRDSLTSDPLYAALVALYNHLIEHAANAN